MMPAWFLRLNRRERILGSLVVGTIFLLINVFIWSGLVGGISRIHTEMAKRKTTRAAQAVYLNERSMWAAREGWLQKHQPTLKSPVEASTLLDQVKQVAGKHNLLIENPAIGAGDSTPDHQAVFASVETKSPWPPLVHFLFDIQQPESFVVFESVNLAIDGTDPAMMRGKLKLARWFAPGGTKPK